MKTDEKKVLLGTFSGVFMPSFLTIMGVIIFLRMGYVIGNAGLYYGLLIVLLANSISILTSLSISAIATNTKVKGGGVYYLISRSLGVEFGGPIGLVLFFSQAVSVAFYVIGFAEVLLAVVPQLEPFALVIQGSVCLLVYFCAIADLDWAAKVQFWILIILVLGLLSFFVGALDRFDPVLLSQNLKPSYVNGNNYWIIFAIFFPAITGFTQGVGLSGDLKDPEKSIPIGTILAVVVSFLIYLGFSYLVAGSATRENLQTNLLVMKEISWASLLIDFGVICATLSSALTSFLSAPRILQAMASDNIFPVLKIFDKGYGASQTPRRATTVTLIIALVCIFNGELNTIAPIVTMFFLMTYGLMNYATFVEGFGNNPSFRPRFRFFHWRLSLTGAVACLLIMLFINAVAAALALICAGGLYWLVTKTVRETSWGDAQRGFYFSKIKDYLLRLRNQPFHAKNWRPQVLVLSGRPQSRLPLVKIGQWLEAGRGILTLANILHGRIEEKFQVREDELKTVKQFVLDNQLPVFWEVFVSPTYIHGVESLVQAHSIGGIKPNTVLLGWAEQKEQQRKFIDVIQTLRKINRNIIIVDEEEALFTGARDGAYDYLRNIKIDVWWRGNKNGALMLLLAYLWTQNPECNKGRIRVLRTVAKEEQRQANERELKDLVKSARINAEVKVVVSTSPWTKSLPKYSKEADVTFVGLSIPGEGGEQTFLNTYEPVLKEVKTVVLVKAVEEIDVHL